MDPSYMRVLSACMHTCFGRGVGHGRWGGGGVANLQLVPERAGSCGRRAKGEPWGMHPSCIRVLSAWVHTLFGKGVGGGDGRMDGGGGGECWLTCSRPLREQAHATDKQEGQARPGHGSILQDWIAAQNAGRPLVLHTLQEGTCQGIWAGAGG